MLIYINSKKQHFYENEWDPIVNLEPDWAKHQFWMVFKMSFLKTLPLFLSFKKTTQLFPVNVGFEISNKISYNKLYSIILSYLYLILSLPLPVQLDTKLFLSSFTGIFWPMTLVTTTLVTEKTWITNRSIGKSSLCCLKIVFCMLFLFEERKNWKRNWRQSSLASFISLEAYHIACINKSHVKFPCMFEVEKHQIQMSSPSRHALL